MKGHPLFRLLGVLLVFCLAVLPLWKLTQAKAGAVNVPTATSNNLNQTVTLRLTFAHAPESFRIENLGQVFWQSNSVGTTFEKTMSLKVPKEGTDLVLHADWPKPTPETAVRVDWTLNDGETHTTSLWARTHLEDTITLK
jgi:hypothetical protein